MSKSKKDTIINIPPKDLEAEKNFLGALIFDGTLLTKVLDAKIILSPSDFASEKNAVIYDAIISRSAYSEQFTTTVICSDLENKGLLAKAGGHEYISTLTDLTGPASAVVEYAIIIQNTSQRRRMMAVAEDIISIAAQPEGRSINEIFDEGQGKLFKLAQDSLHQDTGPVGVRYILNDVIESIRKRHENKATNGLMGVPTGFTDFDNLTLGLIPGGLYILAARPGIGKTTFAMNIVENICMDENVDKPALVFSLEMPSSQLLQRMFVTFGRVPKHDFDQGKVTPTQWDDINKKMKRLFFPGSDKSKLYIDDSGDLTPLELRARARKLHQEFGGLSVIMVDYIQLMRGQSKYDNRALEVGEISRSLKILAKDLNVPIIALSQLNRSVENRKDGRPMNSDLRESGSLEQDADLIMFLNRPNSFSEKNGPFSGKVTLIVSKNRHGATKDIELQFRGEYSAFYDATNHINDIDDGGF